MRSAVYCSSRFPVGCSLRSFSPLGSQRLSSSTERKAATMFDQPLKLMLGLVTGIVFGVLLQKGQVGKFQRILGQFLLKDCTVFRVMATSIVVGSIGVHALIALGLASFHIQTASVGRMLIGGTLFGI